MNRPSVITIAKLRRVIATAMVLTVALLSGPAAAAPVPGNNFLDFVSDPANPNQAIKATGQAHDIPFALLGQPENFFYAYDNLKSLKAGAGDLVNGNITNASVNLWQNLDFKKVSVHVDGCDMGLDRRYKEWWIYTYFSTSEVRKYQQCVLSIAYDELVILTSQPFSLDLELYYANLNDPDDDWGRGNAYHIEFNNPDEGLEELDYDLYVLAKIIAQSVNQTEDKMRLNFPAVYSHELYVLDRTVGYFFISQANMSW